MRERERDVTAVAAAKRGGGWGTVTDTLQAGSSITPQIVSATNATCSVYSDVTYLVLN